MASKFIAPEFVYQNITASLNFPTNYVLPASGTNATIGTAPSLSTATTFNGTAAYLCPSSKAAMVRFSFSVLGANTGSNCIFRVLIGSGTFSSTSGAQLVFQTVIPNNQWFSSVVPLDTVQGGVVITQGGIGVMGSTRLQDTSGVAPSAFGAPLPMDYIIGANQAVYVDFVTALPQACYFKVTGVEDDAV